MQISKLKTGFVFILVLLGIGGLLISQNINTVVQSLAGKKAVLSDGSEAVETFVTPPVPLYQNVYMFNLTNYDDVLLGKNPQVEEVGPYVFRIDSTKENLTWTSSFDDDDGSVLSFLSRKTFIFVPELSGDRSLEDEITTVNPFITTIVTTIGKEALPQRRIFFTKTVDELLYNGFEEPDFDPAQLPEVPTVDGRIGYLVGKNGTSEGNFTVHIGDKNLQKVDEISEFHSISYFDNPCEPLRGTNGERFAPFASSAPGKVTFFNPVLCKPWDLYYAGNVDVNGLTCARFSNGRDFFSPSLNESLNECFDGGIPGVARTQGTFYAGACLDSNSVVYYSLPHFYNADSDLVDNVKGLSPNATKHDFHFDVYPALGFVVNMKVRAQINLKLVPTVLEPKLPNVMYPVFWQEILLLDEDRETAAGIIQKKVVSLTSIIFFVSLGVGVAFLLVSQLLLFSGCFKKANDDDDDDSYSPNVGYNARDRSVYYN